METIRPTSAKDERELPEEPYQIFCDMDGVLTDFSKAAKIIFPGYIDFDDDMEEELWDRVDASKGSYWANLPWMPDGKKLWNHIIKLSRGYEPVTVLTSPPRRPRGRGYAIKGKSKWLKENGISNKVIFENDKFKYATSHGILIDDQPKKINKWVSAGGVGIVHKSARDTIQQLDKLYVYAGMI